MLESAPGTNQNLAMAVKFLGSRSQWKPLNVIELKTDLGHFLGQITYPHSHAVLWDIIEWF